MSSHLDTDRSNEMNLDHVHAYTPDEAVCADCGGHEYEVQVYGSWHHVTAYIFRSYTGPRRLDGETYVGPVYVLGSTEVYA